MVINCEECGKRYKIDEEKLVKTRTLLNCPNCKSAIEVLKPKQSVETIEPDQVPGDMLKGNSAAHGSFQTVGRNDTSESEPRTPKPEWKTDPSSIPAKSKSKGLTIGEKLLLVFIAFILLTGSILTLVYMKFVPALMHDQIDLRTYSISRSFSAAIQQPLLVKNYLRVNKTAEANAALPGVAYVSVLNKRGVVVAGILGHQDRFAPDFIERVKTRGFPKEILAQNRIPSGQKESAADFSMGGQEIHDVAVMIGDTGGEAHVGLFTADVDRAVRQSLFPLLIFLLVIAFLGGLCFLMVAQTISRPIHLLSQAAERISLGELDMPIEVKGGGEISDLAASLERMRFSIKAAIKRLRRN